MPQSKQVNPSFQQALRHAIRSFKNAKQPLWSHHYEQIVAIERVVNNAHQSNRELRDNARRVCNEINGNWRNWLISSLLASNIEAVLNDPRFNVEKMYEGVIDQQEEVIDLQVQRIELLEEENNKLGKNLPDYVTDLKEKLKHTECSLTEVTELQRRNLEQLAQNQQMIQSLSTKLDERDKNYQSLMNQYLQTFDEKHHHKPSHHQPQHSAQNPTRNRFTLPTEISPQPVTVTKSSNTMRPAGRVPFEARPASVRVK